MSPVLDPLLPHLVEMLRLAEEAYDYCQARYPLFAATFVLSLTCKDGQRLAAQHPALVWMWTYETHLHPPWSHAGDEMAANRDLRFCDGLPPRFNPADEQAQPWGPRAHPNDPLNPSAPTRQTDVYNPEAVAKLRCYMAARIDARYAAPSPRPPPADLDEKDRSVGFPEDYNATGGQLPDGLPEPVRRFLGFLRYWSHLLFSSLYLSTKVRICDHKRCLRTCAAHLPAGAEKQTGFAGRYWALAIDGLSSLTSAAPLEWPPHMCYCSRTCFNAAGTEFLAKVRLCDEHELEAAPPRKRSGAHAGLSGMYRAALERNQLVARRLREQERARSHATVAAGEVPSFKHFRFPHPHIGVQQQAQQLVAYQAKLVDALNLDTGLLMAASIVAELPLHYRVNKVLPRQPQWREDFMMYQRALCYVRRLYAQHHLKKKLVLSTSDDLVTCTSGARPAWLEAVKSHAHSVF